MAPRIGLASCKGRPTLCVLRRSRFGIVSYHHFKITCWSIACRHKRCCLDCWAATLKSSIVCVVQSVFFYAAIRGIHLTSCLNIVVKNILIPKGFTNASAISHYTGTCYCGCSTGSNGEGVVVLKTGIDLFVCSTCCLVGKQCHYL